MKEATSILTQGAFDTFDKEDVSGLLKNRLEKANEDLEAAREQVKALCEPVPAPQRLEDYFHYFCAEQSGNAEQLKANEPKRQKLYKFVSTFVRAYANIANELAEAGYKPSEIEKIKAEVDHYSQMRDAVKLNSEDYIDLKVHEPAMRYMIDQYIRADESEKISAFDDMSLIQLIVERGPSAVDSLPKGIKNSEEAVAETIENNVRKLIINETPIDPAYYEKMSKLLDALIEQRRKGAISYKDYLEKIAQLTKEATNPSGKPGGYPPNIKTGAQRAIYNNLGKDEGLALAVDAAILKRIQHEWWSHDMKAKRVSKAIKAVLSDDELTKKILELAKNQHDYRKTH